jgi:hypothetical protein
VAATKEVLEMFRSFRFRHSGRGLKNLKRLLCANKQEPPPPQKNLIGDHLSVKFADIGKTTVYQGLKKSGSTEEGGGGGTERIFQAGFYLFAGIFLTTCFEAISRKASKRNVQDFSQEFEKSIASSTISSWNVTENFIDRPELQRKMNQAFKFIPEQAYYVVYGNKAVGKSQLVAHSALNKKGVIHLIISSALSKDDITNQILNVLKFPDTQLGISQLILEMSNVKEKYDIYPTIILEVECSGSPEKVDDEIDVVRSFAKSLAVACRCIIVLSEASTVVNLGRDPARERFIFVDELKREEAKQFLIQHNFAITEDEMNFVFDSIGTCPLTLLRLTKTVKSLEMTIEAFVEERVRMARQDLLAFPLQTILKALKDHPEGVYQGYFKNQKEKGVDLSNHLAVGKMMKNNPNPILYRRDTGNYHLLSTAHKTALRSYDPSV